MIVMSNTGLAGAPGESAAEDDATHNAHDVRSETLATVLTVIFTAAAVLLTSFLAVVSRLA
jgi:hypothetical protein